MKLRIIKPEGLYAVGDVIEPDMPDVSRMLIARGIAEPIAEEPEKVAEEPEKVAEEPEEDETPAPLAFTPPNKMVRREKVKTKSASPAPTAS
jgi:hypothetical protein